MSINSEIESLEAKMRPGQSSQGGFLGSTESLDAVITHDEEIIAKFGLTHDQVAQAIEKVVEDALNQKRSIPWEKRTDERKADFPYLLRPETLPDFSLDNLPDINQGYCVDHFQFFMIQWRGYQDCPWGCPNAGGSFDFMILNRKTGNSFTAPSLITHLIKNHHFFEGVESPYRCDPEKVILVFELANPPAG
jgi:hypothetical protein